MITIQFSNIGDCHHIYKRIRHEIEGAGERNFMDINVRQKKGNRLMIWSEQKRSLFQSTVQPLLAYVFMDYIVDTYEKQWIIDLLESKFYYADSEEKNTIVSVAGLIMDGEKPELPQVDKLPSRKDLIEEAMLSLLREGDQDLSFSFDSFIQFRLKEYRECLLTYVKMAIDEYKLEQDYQNLIENLRAFINRKKPVIEKICVVHDKKTIFYDENLLRIDNDVIQDSVKTSNLFFGSTLIEPSLLQPLLALAPRQIDLYTNAEESGILYTLQNIFQERLIVYPLDLFVHRPSIRDSVSKKRL